MSDYGFDPYVPYDPSSSNADIGDLCGNPPTHCICCEEPTEGLCVECGVCLGCWDANDEPHCEFCREVA